MPGGARSAGAEPGLGNKNSLPAAPHHPHPRLCPAALPHSLWSRFLAVARPQLAKQAWQAPMAPAAECHTGRGSLPPLWPGRWRPAGSDSDPRAQGTSDPQGPRADRGWVWLVARAQTEHAGPWTSSSWSERSALCGLQLLGVVGGMTTAF